MQSEKGEWGWKHRNRSAIQKLLVEEKTMTAKDTMNGGVDLLAKAMRQVFSEEVEKGVGPLTTEIMAMQTDMQAQFPEQEKKVSNLIAK